MAAEIAKVQMNENHSSTITNLCQEYKETVKVSLMVADYNLKSAFEENYDGLDLLSNKIEVYLLKMKSKRTRNNTFLEKSDWNLVENNVKLDDLQEFEEIKTSLRENVRKIVKKIEEIESLHKTLVCNVKTDTNEIDNDNEIGNDNNDKENDKEDLAIEDSEKEINSVEIDEIFETVERNEDDVTTEKPEQNVTAEIIVDPKMFIESFRTNVSDFSKGSFDRVTMCEIRSNVDLKPQETDNNHNKEQSKTEPSPPAQTQPSVVPDLTRRKAFQDLHQKLIDLDATDSLESFNVLMSRKNQTKIDLASLSPANRHKVETKIAKRLKRIQDERLKQKYAGSVWFFRNKSSGKLDKGDELVMRASMTSRTESCTGHRAKKLTSRNKIGSSTTSCPAKPIEKCQSLPVPALPKISLKPSICQAKLKYYDLLDDLNVDDLKPFKAEYPRKDQVVERSKMDDLANNQTRLLSNILESHDNIWKQLIVPPKFACRNQRRSADHNNAVKSKNTKNLMKYLTAPQRRAYTEQKLIVMPVKVYYDNFPTKETVENDELVEQTEDCNSGVSIRKSPFFTELESDRTEDQKEDNTEPEPVKLVNDQEIEIKVVKRQFFKNQEPAHKNRTLIDSRMTKCENDKTTDVKIDKRQFTIKRDFGKCTNSSERHKLSKPTSEDKDQKRDNSTKLEAVKTKNCPIFMTDLTKLHQAGDCCINGATSANIQIGKIELTSKTPRLPVPPPSVPPPPPPLPDLVRPFLNHNPGLKVAPTHVVMTALVDNKNKLKSSLPSQQQMHRKRLMLEHLKSLKVRNDNIQKNIQKAIDVIETKMLDILSSPTDECGNIKVNAFNAMEKEITNVLKLMSDDEKRQNTNVEKYQAEKDESVKLLKRQLPVTNVDVTPRQNHASNQRSQAKPKKNVTIYTKNTNKKMADMADSEKLLGQVDNVVKKIDDIYTKFYDDNLKDSVESPRKSTIKKCDNSFNEVIEFLDNIKNMIEDPPVLVDYKELHGVAMEFQVCHSFGMAHFCHELTYYEETPEPDLISFSVDEDTTDITDKEMSDFVAVDDPPDSDNDLLTIIDSDSYMTLERLRDHENTLKTFYAIFFSTIFAAMNLDFT